MDKVNHYRELVKSHLEKLARLSNRRPGGVDTACVFDDEQGHYLLLDIGWNDRRRVRATTLYVRIKDSKVWVEEDMTESGIATALVKAGVPKEDIVLAFQHPSVRPLTEFAVA